MNKNYNTEKLLHIPKGGADEVASCLREKILQAEDTLPIGEGRVYYLSENGDDTHDGTSPDTAWQSLHAYAAHREYLEAGDTVLFERGSVFRGFLGLVSGVSYGAYGKGDKPAIYGSMRNFNSQDDWVKTDRECVWACSQKFTADVGVIVFDEGKNVGIKKIDSAMQLNEDFDFYHDKETETLLLYLSKHPADAYQNIEICDGRHNLIQGFAGCKDVIIENLAVKYGGNHGIHFVGDASNITIRNCEIGWIGGCFMSGTLRFGNGIEFWNSCHDILMENNWVYQIYDAGMTHQGGITSDGNTQSNITYRGNLVEYCTYAIEFFAGNKSGDVMKNILIEENILRFSGYGWGMVRPNPQKVSFICGWGYNSNYEVSDFQIRGNIFDMSDNYLFVQFYDREMPFTYYYNTYYQRPGRIADWEFGEQLSADTQEELEHVVEKIDGAPCLVKLLEKM